MKSFLLIGQSNMAGRGDFGEVPEIINPKCFMFRNGRWQPMSEPINPDRQIFGYFHSGVGLAASFADEYTKHFNENIGLIPCADGGTSIKQWQPGELLYDNAVAQVKLAKRTSDFTGILWHQGENDAMDFDGVKYRNNFIQMMTELRKELNAENLPIIIGEISEDIAPSWNVKYAKEMNVLLMEIAQEIPHCKLTPAKDLELKNDGIHFSSKSYRTLGKRYFEKYMELV